MKALRRTYMDVDILDDNHTVCDSRSHLVRSLHAFDEGMAAQLRNAY
jgi:hypothetical protein